jgi:hypothetical protein
MSMAIGGVIVGGAVLNSITSDRASKRAANAQTAAADKASATALEQYYQTRDDQAPWRGAGTFALSQLVGGMGGNPATVTGASGSGVPGGTIGPLNAGTPPGATDGGLGRGAYSTTGNTTGDLIRSFSLADLAADPQYRATVGSAPRDFSRGFTAQALGADPIYARTVGNRDFSKGFTAQDLQSDPSYQWRLGQGQQALERSAAARGGALSGGALKDLANYAQGAASQEYQNAYGRWSNDRAFAADQGANAYNRWNGERATQQSAYQDAYNRFNSDTTSRFNRLSSLAGIGQQANNTVASLGAQTAAQVGQNQLAAGNARAAGYVGTANAVNNGMSSLQSMYFMNKYLGGGGASPSPAGGGYTPTSMYGGDTGMTGGFDNLPMYA